MAEQGPAPTPGRRRGGSEQAPASSKYAETTQLPPIALAAAGGVALAGALAWGFMISSAGYELGWLAWGIGAAIGYACRQMGGRGMGAALICGALAVVSIFAGKYIGASERINDEREKFEALLTPADDPEVPSAALREIFEEALPTPTELVQRKLGGFDLLFIALGVGSAFTLAGRGGAGRRPSRRRGRRIEPPPSDPEEPDEPRPPPLPNA